MSKYAKALEESRRINLLKRMKYHTVIKLSSGTRRAYTNNKAQNEKMRKLNTAYNAAVKAETIAAKARRYQREKTGAVTELTANAFAAAQEAVKVAHNKLIAALQTIPVVETRHESNRIRGGKAVRQKTIILEIRNKKASQTSPTTDDTFVLIRLNIEVDLGSETVTQVNDYFTISITEEPNMTIGEYAAKYYGLMPTDYDIINTRKKTTQSTSKPIKG